ncbi:hypothetical protein SPRG_11781 [Saprolegnia parasitica CBS 223.65]|uniref:Potassium channel tetramerisation-type BTB domain-containing protein n=1 Tax=Saprolegnia parasitica (strain CBS 223.65) TaxID=695850 RepID=A0A067C7Z4_SAPPC|nr:hypothetical protein SPRG_11781 [Saprolegnia parasitica CBS 223.65]KDO22937.1 hypothetical protein SPRG_11781 [Saprolegnia parasitica CBS 223.65]|eukprot:XP_012206373.1 hypothetical protein SPRG_11781 [Saprolegnia parasitica CBS 223.65]
MTSTASDAFEARWAELRTLLSPEVQGPFDVFVTDIVSAFRATQRSTVAPPTEIVTLNVGGTRFATSRETLLRFEDSYFHALLQWPPTDNGEYVLDFDPIMTYFRSGHLPLNRIPGDAQADFYKLVDFLHAGDTVMAKQRGSNAFVGAVATMPLRRFCVSAKTASSFEVGYCPREAAGKIHAAFKAYPAQSPGPLPPVVVPPLDETTVLVTRDDDSISFQVNGVLLDQHCTDVPSTLVLYPAARLWNVVLQRLEITT